jgi:nucleotide-binding universal stress UspA family protein
MNKIIAAFDGLKYSESACNYAINIAKKSGMHLVGVFLDDITYSSYKIYELITQQGVSEKKLKDYEEKDKATRAAAATAFENACRRETIEHSIHHDRNIAINELKHESIYADLLVIDSKETLTHYSEELPTRFVRELLEDLQCPVLLAPAKFKPVEKIVLLYDGTPSSVQAIKMFSYTMPQFNELPTEVISVKNVGSSKNLADNRLLKEFTKRHFPKTTYTVLKGLAENEIPKYIKAQKENVLVVLGAYKRGAVSRWLHHSLADVLMKELKSPLYIAHN